MSEPKLFAPKGKQDLVHLHPTLDQYKEFKPLNSEELLFSWYFFCRASHLNGRSREEKLTEACKEAFGSKWEKKYAEMRHGFSEEIRQAGGRWEKFDIGSRMEAQLVARMTSKRIRGILEAPLGKSLQDPLGETDWGKTRDYLNAVKVGNETMASLVRLIEQGGYGIEEGVENEAELVEGEVAEHVHKREL